MAKTEWSCHERFERLIDRKDMSERDVSGGGGCGGDDDHDDDDDDDDDVDKSIRHTVHCFKNIICLDTKESEAQRVLRNIMELWHGNFKIR